MEKDENGWTHKNIPKNWSNYSEKEVFTTTIDYPYLVWCLENGVNVLFTVCGKMMYFRLISETNKLYYIYIWQV